MQPRDIAIQTNASHLRLFNKLEKRKKKEEEEEKEQKQLLE